jgi:hypothetical protein
VIGVAFERRVPTVAKALDLWRRAYIIESRQWGWVVFHLRGENTTSIALRAKLRDEFALGLRKSPGGPKSPGPP